MSSIAEIILSARDDATAQIERVAASLRDLHTASTGKTIDLSASSNASGIQAQTSALSQNERQTRQLESAQISLSRQSRDYAGAIGQIDSALKRSEGDELRVLQLQKQRISVEQQLARETAKASRSSGGGILGSLEGAGKGIGGISSTLSTLGLALAGSQVLQFGADAIRSANDLEKTEATVRILAGSTRRYNDVLDLARQGQARYGGTLKDNLDGLGAFVNLANKTGASLADIDKVARKLQLKSPEQGIEGSLIAINELLNDTGATATHSLQARFEIPRPAIRALGDESLTAQQKIAGLDKALVEMGFTDASLTAATTTTAHQFDLLASAWDNFKNKVGSGGAQIGAPIAAAATAGLNILSGTPNPGITSPDTAALKVPNYEAYVAQTKALADANKGVTQAFTQQLGPAGALLLKLPQLLGINTGLATSYHQLSQAEFQAVQGLAAQGVPLDQAAQRVSKLSTLQLMLSGESLKVHGASQQVTASLQAQAPQLLAVAASSETLRNAATVLLNARIANKITDAQYAVGHQDLVERQGREAVASATSAFRAQELADARKASTSATDAASAALLEHQRQLDADAAKSAADAAQSQLAAQAKSQVEAFANAAAQALFNEGAQAAGQVAKLLASKDATDQLVGAKYQLIAAEAQLGNVADASSAKAASDRADRGYGPQKSAAAIQAEIAAAQAKGKYQFDTANDAGKLAQLNAQLRSLNPNMKAYWEIKKQIFDIEQRQTKASGAGSSATAAAQRADETAGLSPEAKLAVVERQLAGAKQGTKLWYQLDAERKKLEAQIAKGSGSGASAAASAQDRANVAGLDDTQELAYWQNKLKTLKKGSTEYNNTLAKVKNLEERVRKGTGSGGGASALESAQERADTAGLDTAGELRYWQQKLGHLKQGSVAYLDALAKVKDLEKRLKNEQARGTTGELRDTRQLQDAKDALLSDEARLAAYRQRVASGKLPEIERLELMKKIADLEKSITGEQEKQRKAAIDAQLAALDDAKQRRAEVKQEAEARRVLASAATNAEQKAAAADVLARIPLEQAKRAQEIADKQREAAGAQAQAAADLKAKPVGTPTSLKTGAPMPVKLADTTLPPLPPGLAGGPPIQVSIPISIIAELPNGQTATGTATYTGDLRTSPLSTLRIAWKQQGSARPAGV